MKKTMKQMLTALLAVAMIAGMLVVPGVAANNVVGVNYYSVSLDTDVVNVYATGEDTTATVAYTVSEDVAVYAISVDTSVATATVADGEITVTGVAEGSTYVYVVAADAAVTTVAEAQAAGDKLAVIAVTVKAVSVAGDKTELNAAIANATKLAGTYTVRPDTTVASNVKKGSKFVWQSDKDALDAAIAAAQAVADKAGATQAEVDQALADLNSAMATFNAAVQTGTKTGVNTSTGSIRDDGRGEPTTPAVVGNFVDVPADAWYASSVKYCLEKNLVNGTSDTTFEPTMTTTRGMVMTVLARLAGVDTTGGETWYSKAVEWAVEQGISDGTNPEAVMTREQLAVMLYRYAKAEPVENAMDFVDADQISDWAVEAMTWAVSKGIVLGKGAQDLDPQGVCTRAEMVTMLARFCKL